MTRRLILVALLVAGCGEPPTSSAPASPALPSPAPASAPLMRVAERTTAPTGEPAASFVWDDTANRYGVTMTGPGNGRSAEMELVGDYTLAWEASERTCAMETHLEFAEGGRVFEEFTPPSRSGTGTVTVRPATYVLAVTSGCAWSFTFSPR